MYRNTLFSLSHEGGGDDNDAIEIPIVRVICWIDHCKNFSSFLKKHEAQQLAGVVGYLMTSLIRDKGFDCIRSGHYPHVLVAYQCTEWLSPTINDCMIYFDACLIACLQQVTESVAGSDPARAI